MEPLTTAATIASLASSLGKLFGGSGKTPSVLQGFAVEGTFGPGGFSGTVTAGDQQGNRWGATGEQAYLNSVGRTIAQFRPEQAARATDAEIDRYFAGGGIPIPVRYTHGPDNSNLAVAVGDWIVGQVKAGLRVVDDAEQQRQAERARQEQARAEQERIANEAEAARRAVAAIVADPVNMQAATIQAATPAVTPAASSAGMAPAVAAPAAGTAAPAVVGSGFPLELAAIAAVVLGAVWWLAGKGGK